MILAGDYDLAESGVPPVPATYPDDELAPDAQYWLGESLFARGDYARGGEEFLRRLQGLSEERQGARHAPQARPVAGRPRLARRGLLDLCGGAEAIPADVERLRQRVKTEQASASC